MFDDDDDFFFDVLRSFFIYGGEVKTKRSIIFIVSFFVSFYVPPFAFFFFGMSTHIFEDSFSAQQRTPVSAQLGLLVFVSACKGLLFFACIQRETQQQQQKKKREKKDTQKTREREKEKETTFWFSFVTMRTATAGTTGRSSAPPSRPILGGRRRRRRTSLRFGGGGGGRRSTFFCAKTSSSSSSSSSSSASMRRTEEFVAFAIELAEAANAETMKYWRRTTSFSIETKTDESPVTVADKNAESKMRALVKSRYPSHAIFGEEHGIEVGAEKSGAEDGHEYVWVFDPIDGTKSFITGKPLWGTLIALLRDGEPVLGVLEQPVLKERWVGCKGTQTTFNGVPISVHGDEKKELKDALMYSTTPLMFYDENETRYEQLKRDVKIPMFGCDCYAYGLLASGFCDIVCEADLKPYDYMALVPIVLGAGGKMTDWEGEALKFVVDDDGGDAAAARGAPPFQGEVLAAASERLWKESVRSLRTKA